MLKPMNASPYTPLDNPALIEKLTSLLDVATGIGSYQIGEESKLGVVVRLGSEDTVAVLDVLHKDTDLRFEQLIDVFGADLRNLIEVSYRLRSLVNNIDLIIKCELPYGAVYSSVGEVYAAAWMPERELCEMFGLVLANHPNPKRLLTTDALPPFLRKDVAIRTKEEIWG
jgi:NADH:ubiquinone oxidoreductase subunit C